MGVASRPAAFSSLSCALASPTAQESDMADTPQVTFEKMKTMHSLIVKHQAGIKKAYEAARKDLRAGIDHESEEEIKLALPALDAAVGKIDPGLDACERMQTMAAELLKHADFVAAHKEDVKKFVSESAAAKKELTEWAAEARKLKAEADRPPAPRTRAPPRPTPSSAR
jgi:hypothetical protein